MTGVDFSLKRTMPVWMLGWVIALLRFFKPGKKDEERSSRLKGIGAQCALAPQKILRYTSLWESVRVKE